MTIDLRLLPCEDWHETNGQVWGTSRTILSLGSVSREAYDAFHAIVKPHLMELPKNHDVVSFVGALVPDGSYKDEHVYGRFRDTDSYGKSFMFTAARHLLPWLEEHFRYDRSRGGGPYQASIIAFIRMLPPDTKIVLDWH